MQSGEEEVLVCGGKLYKKIDFKTTTFVFGMEMVVILLVNLLVNGREPVALV